MITLAKEDKRLVCLAVTLTLIFAVIVVAFMMIGCSDNPTGPGTVNNPRDTIMLYQKDSITFNLHGFNVMYDTLFRIDVDTMVQPDTMYVQFNYQVSSSAIPLYYFLKLGTWIIAQQAYNEWYYHADSVNINIFYMVVIPRFTDKSYALYLYLGILCNGETYLKASKMKVYYFK